MEFYLVDGVFGVKDRCSLEAVIVKLIVESTILVLRNWKELGMVWDLWREMTGWGLVVECHDALVWWECWGVVSGRLLVRRSEIGHDYTEQIRDMKVLWGKWSESGSDAENDWAEVKEYNDAMTSVFFQKIVNLFSALQLAHHRETHRTDLLSFERKR